MKFGKYLARRQLDLPEYADHFVNYKALKKLINRLAASPEAPGQPLYQNLQMNKVTFFFQLEREIESAQRTYQQKEADLTQRLEILVQRKIKATESGTLHKTNVTYISLHEAFQRFRRDLERLEQFVDLNQTALVKVLKKWDKRSRSQTKELYLSSTVDVQPMFNRDNLVRMCDSVNASLLELEALDSGDALIFEAAPASDAASSDDLFYEFIKFVSVYDANSVTQQQQLEAWKSQLVSADNPQERITQVFLMAISTKAKDQEALLALYETGFVDLQATDESTLRNCLHLAALHANRERIVDLALAKGVSISARDTYERTPLHYAVMRNERNLAMRFVEAGADINLLDQDNYSPLHYSIILRFGECTRDLVKAGAKLTGNSSRDHLPLNLACLHGATEAVKILLSTTQGQKMDIDAEGLFPLHIAARGGFSNLIPLLLDAGAPIDQVDKLNSWTALTYAAREGHHKVIGALLERGADSRILDERGFSALFYACWEGHPGSLKLLAAELGEGEADISRNSEIHNEAHRSSEDAVGAVRATPSLGAGENDLNAIPDLSLPPPIIPLQRYGHNFLDSQKTVLRIMFDTRSTLAKPLRFKEDRKFLSAGRMKITATNSKDSIPRNLALPLQDGDRVQTFQLEAIDKFSLEVEILPTFGTRSMAKAIALSSTFSPDGNKAVLPLINALVRHVGEIEFNYTVVKPYDGKSLDFNSGDAYWKTTRYLESASLSYPHGVVHATRAGEMPPNTFSVVTDTSLRGAYRRVPVSLTLDKVPILSPPYVCKNNITSGVPSLTLAELKQVLGSEVVTLAEALEEFPPNEQLTLDFEYPTEAEEKHRCVLPLKWPDHNEYVDTVLHVLFKHVRLCHECGVKTRNLMFTSANPEMCAVLNWKQPNFPVLFSMTGLRTDGIYVTANQHKTAQTNLGENLTCSSIKEASQFASNNNLMGIILPTDLMELVPSVVSATRMLGLVLVARGSRAPAGVDGLQDTATGITTFFSTRR